MVSSSPLANAVLSMRAHAVGGLNPLRQRRPQVTAVERPLIGTDDRFGDVLGDDAVIADDDVVKVPEGVIRAESQVISVEEVLAGGQHVEPGPDAGVDRRNVEGARDDIDVDAGVAVNLIEPALADDRVVAGAAREVIAGLAADDQVVRRPAVDSQPYRRQLSIRDGRELGAGVDDVVAEVVEGARDGQEEVRRAAAELARERLDAEVADREAVRVARVPDAVLRRVAEDDEREPGNAEPASRRGRRP
jgi:hypothetical protein